MATINPRIGNLWPSTTSKLKLQITISKLDIPILFLKKKEKKQS